MLLLEHMLHLVALRPIQIVSRVPIIYLLSPIKNNLECLLSLSSNIRWPRRSSFACRARCPFPYIAGSAPSAAKGQVAGEG